MRIEKFNSREFVYNIREQIRLGQGYFATALGQPGRKDIVSKIENGTRKLSVEELYSICQIFQVDITGKPLKSKSESFDWNRVTKILDELYDEYERKQKNSKRKSWYAIWLHNKRLIKLEIAISD